MHFLIKKRLLVAVVAVVVATVAKAERAETLTPFVVKTSPAGSDTVTDGFASRTTILSASEIQNMGAQDIASALRRVPGVSISRHNMVGAFGGAEGGAIFLRGIGSSRPGGELKVLIDDVPVMSGVFNHPLLDLAPIDAAARIDVHRSVAPLVAGNAFAAIAIRTPELRTNETRRYFFQGSAGSYGTTAARLDLAQRTDVAEAYVQLSDRRSDGHRDFADGRQQNALLRFAADFEDGYAASYVLMRSDNFASDPGDVNAPTTRGETFATENWLHIFSIERSDREDNSHGALRLFWQDGSSDWKRRIFSGQNDTLAEWRSYGLRWRESGRTDAEIDWVVGGDADFTRGSTVQTPLVGVVTRFGPRTQRLLSGFAGAARTYEKDGWSFTPSAGVRFSAHSEFQDGWAPQAGVVLERNGTQLHASASRARSYPGLEVQVFSEALIPALGTSWRGLKPEQLDTLEVGLRRNFGRLDLDATAFRNEGGDRYTIAFAPPPPRYVSIERFTTEGLEFSARWKQSETLAFFGAATLLRVTPGDLPYAPKKSFVGGVHWRSGKWSISTDAQYTDAMIVESQARTSGAVNTRRVGAQFVVNARIARGFEFGSETKRTGELFLTLENLLGREYEYRPGYPMPGTTVMLGFSLNLFP